MTLTGMTGACPVCSLPHVTCGPAAPVIPVDIDTAIRREEYTMADLKVYRYELNGVTTTGQLSEADAERLGAVLADETSAPEPAQSKARPAVHTATRSVPNKGR